MLWFFVIINLNNDNDNDTGFVFLLLYITVILLLLDKTGRQEDRKTGKFSLLLSLFLPILNKLSNNRLDYTIEQ